MDARADALPYGRSVLAAGEAAAALKSKGASVALAGSEAAEAPDNNRLISSKRSGRRSPLKTQRKAPAKKEGRAARRPSLEGSKTVVWQKPVKGWMQQAGHSRSLGPSLYFCCSSWARRSAHATSSLPPSPARGYSVRRPGEEVDERV